LIAVPFGKWALILVENLALIPNVKSVEKIDTLKYTTKIKPLLVRNIFCAGWDVGVLRLDALRIHTQAHCKSLQIA
jgi:hypothetical protein